jgi:hypothetical protein
VIGQVTPHNARRRAGSCARRTIGSRDALSIGSLSPSSAGNVNRFNFYIYLVYNVILASNYLHSTSRIEVHIKSAACRENAPWLMQGIDS